LATAVWSKPSWFACPTNRRAHHKLGASRSHGLNEHLAIRLDRPNNPRGLDGELVVRNALRTVTLPNSDLVVNLLPGMQQEVFREYLQLTIRRLRSLTMELGRTDDSRCEKQDA